MDLCRVIERNALFLKNILLYIYMTYLHIHVWNGIKHAVVSVPDTGPGVGTTIVQPHCPCISRIEMVPRPIALKFVKIHSLFFHFWRVKVYCSPSASILDEFNTTDLTLNVPSSGQNIWVTSGWDDVQNAARLLVFSPFTETNAPTSSFQAQPKNVWNDSDSISAEPPCHVLLYKVTSFLPDSKYESS